MTSMEQPPVLLGISSRRWVKLLIGLVCFGTGITFMKQSQLGLSPWEVLHDGISKVSGHPLGTVSIFIGVIVLLLWIPLREKPGIGTIINTLLVGTTTNLTLPVIHPVGELILQIALVVICLLPVGLGRAPYLGPRLGAGPGDGLMMGLFHRTGWGIRGGRNVLEVSVLAIGWRLGGAIGIGTLAFALGIGPII